jgi:hypothetical protein
MPSETSIPRGLKCASRMVEHIVIPSGRGLCSGLRGVALSSICRSWRAVIGDPWILIS